VRGYSAVQAWAEAANKAGSLNGSKVAAVLDTFDKKPLVIGPTTYTSKLHIQTTRPMAILAATKGKFACVGRFSVEKFPPLQ
jgi:branched-chain amino acid transport system substrate-binding protein